MKASLIMARKHFGSLSKRVATDRLCLRNPMVGLTTLRLW